MKHAPVLAAILLVMLSAGAAFGLEQATKAPTKPAPVQPPAQPMDQKAAMEMMMKLATPGEAHKKLDVLVGTWQVKNSMWMAPGQPPMVSEGTSEQKWVLGGRFIEQRVEGTFMNMPFTGLGYTGYDNYKKKYLAVWMDTAGTTIMNTAGTFNASGKALTSWGRMDDPSTGKVVLVRYRMTIVDKGELLFEMSAPGPDGKDFRMMEIRYTKK